MQSLVLRLGYALVIVAIAVFTEFDQHDQLAVAQGGVAQLMYAAQDDGTIHVYDIINRHAEVQLIRAFGCCADVRGITAAVPTQRLYVMYNRDNQGHVVALDLPSSQVLWDRVLHSPGVDRGNVTPDGSILYLPTWENDAESPYELAIDAETGAEKARIALPPRSHDTIVSLDGQRVFMETKSETASMYIADTSTNQVVQVLGGYCCSGVLAPFAINGAATKIVNQVNGYAGFQLADVAAGGVPEMVPFASGYGGHGIAWTPAENQVWVNDGGAALAHVFDMTAAPPRELAPVATSHPSHWLTFNIDGRFAYVAGRKGSGDLTDVIDAATYQRVGSLGPSEDLLEVDFAAGEAVAVGNQFGVGRIRPQPGG
jgi:hypothetical protein